MTPKYSTRQTAIMFGGILMMFGLFFMLATCGLHTSILPQSSSSPDEHAYVLKYNIMLETWTVTHDPNCPKCLERKH